MMERDPRSWDITAEAEDGEFIDSPNIDFRDFIDAVHRWAPKDMLKSTHCLQYIDDYGDTTFNRLQKPVLLMELEALVLADSEDVRDFFQPIIDFLLKYKDDAAAYVKFYGD